MSQEQAEELLLKNENIDKFVNENSEKIFGQKKEIKVLEIKRSKTLNPTSFNVLYHLDVSGQPIDMRASTSTTYANDYNYDTLTFLQSHGFSDGDITVAKPFTFFDEFNLLFYEDVPGKVFISELGDSIETLKHKLDLAANALKKLHVFVQSEVPIKLWDHKWQFNQDQIKKYFPEFANNIDQIRDKLVSNVDRGQKYLCHGDYQPNNLVFNNDHLYIIDWGSTTFAAKELDLACFATQLGNMLYKKENQSDYKLLREYFLTAYGHYDKEIFHSFCALYSLQMLDSTLEFTDFESNKERIYYVYDLVKENLANIKLNES